MSDKPDHVLRPSLPWRDTPLSECGITNPTDPLTRDELVARVRHQGQKRAALTTCMTCFETAQRWPTWEQDPVRRMGREFYHGGRARNEDALRNELVALATLVAAHRDEFDNYLTGLADTPRLDEQRRRRAAR